MTSIMSGCSGVGVMVGVGVLVAVAVAVGAGVALGVADGGAGVTVGGAAVAAGGALTTAWPVGEAQADRSRSEAAMSRAKRRVVAVAVICAGSIAKMGGEGKELGSHSHE